MLDQMQIPPVTKRSSLSKVKQDRDTTQGKKKKKRKKKKERKKIICSNQETPDHRWCLQLIIFTFAPSQHMGGYTEELGWDLLYDKNEITKHGGKSCPSKGTSKDYMT